MKTAAATIARPKPPMAPKAPQMLGEIHIRPVKNGLVVAHYGRAGSPTEYRPKLFGFKSVKGSPAINQVVAHLQKHAGKLIWLGGKTMELRRPGAKMEHRIKQVETSSYPAAKARY